MIQKQPEPFVREIRRKGVVVKSESWKAESAGYRPTMMPLIGSRSSALSTVPATSIVSMASPVLNE